MRFNEASRGAKWRREMHCMLGFWRRDRENGWFFHPRDRFRKKKSTYTNFISFQIPKLSIAAFFNRFRTVRWKSVDKFHNFPSRTFQWFAFVPLPTLFPRISLNLVQFAFGMRQWCLNRSDTLPSPCPRYFPTGNFRTVVCKDHLRDHFHFFTCKSSGRPGKLFRHIGHHQQNLFFYYF